MNNNEFLIDLIANLQQAKSKKQINADIKVLEKAINMLRITGTLAKGDTKREINQYIKDLSSKLGYVKLNGKFDDKRLKREINRSLQNLSFKDIDVLKIDENKTKLKFQKVISDIKAYAERNPVFANIEMKKEKLNNDLTTFLNKNSKIRESEALLKESEKIRNLINSVDNKDTLKNATEAFQLYKSEVSATGYASKSTADKIKGMLAHITKIGSFFGVASLAVNNFRQSLNTLKGNDTILTEISKTSEMTRKQLEELGNEAFRIASKYGQLSNGYLLGVQEMARSGYEELSKELGELSLLAQSAGNMTAENANNYLLATDAAYKYGGSLEKLNEALDGANYISNRNSASLTDIADATRVSATFASNAGVAIDELTAAEATMIATTKRSGSEIGRAFRSIILNLQQVSGEFDGEIIDEDQLKKVEARCHSLGVELEYMKDGIATLRNPMEVLKDLARVYNSLPDNSADKQGLISDLGGKYHANALSSLLSRWDLYEKMLSEFSQGTGSALEEAEKTANSWEGRLNSLQNSFDSFVNTLTNKNAIMGGISFFDRLIQGSESLINSVGEITVMITGLHTAMTALNKDYGITQIYDKDKGKFDIQGNILGIDITNIKNMKKHFAEAEGAILLWNDTISSGENILESFDNKLFKNNTHLKAYLATCSKDAPASLEGYKSYLNAAGVATDGLRLKTVLMNAVISFGIGFAMQLATKAVSGLYELSQVSSTVAEKAKDLGSSFKSTASDIDDYKSKIEELHKTISDSNSSIAEVTDARKNLMTIQDELIEKYGTEKEVIDTITQAINGQADAFDRLSEKQWVETKNKFNDTGFWEGMGNWLDGFDSNIDRMTSQMENARNILSFSYKDFSSGEFEELSQQLSKLGWKYQDTLGGFVKNGNLKEIYSDIIEIQGLVKDTNVPDNFLKDLTRDANEAKETIDSYSEIWNNYILRDVILENEKLSQSWNDINEAYDKYKNAFESGDNDAINNTIGEFAQILNNVLDSSDVADSVKEYFRDMHPVLTNEVEKWEFRFKVLPDLDTHALKGKTQADVLEMLQTNGLQYGEETFASLLRMASDYGIIVGDDSEKIQQLLDLLVEWEILQGNILENSTDTVTSFFDISTYKDTLSDIKSSIETLRSALDSFNKGELDKIQVIDLMQQFPELVPYIDLTAEGFGNLSEGLSTLIAQQPDSLIQSLQALKDSLATDEEREQVELLIDSLQRLSSYGDSGTESYATSIGSTWDDTANVIEGVITQFENLAKVQETVADGLTISANAAAELGKIYPEILDHAQVTANGQITLNEEVVNSILDGDKSIIDAQIAKLEADKAVLTAKKEYAEAQLNIAKQVAEGEGNITKEIAQYRIDAANSLLKALIEAGLEEDRAYAAVAANMAGNTDEFNRIVGAVAQDIAVNMDNAAVSMADSIDINSINAQTSFEYLQEKVWDVADAIEAAPKGERGGKLGKGKRGGGSTSKGGIKVETHSGDFNTTLSEYSPKEFNLDNFQSQLELDIKGYADAISNIDSQIEILKNLQATFDNNGGIGGHGYADQIKQLEKDRDKINNALKDDTGSAKTEFSETVDFFKRRIEVLNKVLSLLDSAMDNLSGSFAKNSLVDAELGITEEKFNNYTDALSMYTQKANEALSKLPADIAAKVKDGAVALTDFIGEGNKNVVEAIKEYESWADEIADCQQNLAELQKEIRQLELTKFTNIMEDFSNQFNLRDNSKDLISKQVDLLKEAGELIGESFFKAQIDQSQKQLQLLEAEKAQLVNQMSSAISSGKIQSGTEEWLEMVNALNSVDGNILDCKKSIEGFNNELLNIHTEIFERIQEQFSNLDSELSNIIDLFDGFDVSDEKGMWSKEGITQLGLLSQQYELAQYQVKQYGNEIDELNAQYMAGNYTATEYADKLAELNSRQWDSLKSVESAKNAILELNKARVENQIKGIEKEIDAYDELIQSQIKALKSEKDLHDYKNSIADKTKAVTDLERQIAALQYDTSASGVAKRKKLEEQLVEAKKALSEEEYLHNIEAQEEALNNQFEQYEAAQNKEIESLRESLNNKEAILNQSFNTVKENASLIGQEIAQIAVEHGITISAALISSWQSGGNAIAGYGEVLSQNTSAFIGNIMGVENEVWNLQTQANNTANSLAWMFSSKADNLVNELTTSYYAEANLANMTNTLQQSLVNALERGYNVSSIVNSLASIENAANSAKRAIDNMNNASSTGGYNGGSTGKANDMNTGKYQLIDKMTGRIWKDNLSYAEAMEYKKDHVTDINTTLVKKYASGTRNAKGGLRVKNEEGPELTLPKLKSGNYAIGNEGDQILTKSETDNIYKWAQFDPDKMLPANFMENLWKYARVPEPVIDKNINNNPIEIGNLINVEGSIDSSNIKQMKVIAKEAVNDFVNKMHDGITYGRRM